MIRLTYSQLMNFNSPVISKLLSSDNRQFPVDDALRLAGILDQVQAKVKLYRDQARKVVEQYGGSFDAEGAVKYRTAEIRSKVEAELEKLNAVEVEINGDKLSKTDNWPNLSIFEAMILRPLLDAKSGGISG